MMKPFDCRVAIFPHAVDGTTLAGVCWDIEHIAVQDHFGMPWFSYFFVFNFITD